MTSHDCYGGVQVDAHVDTLTSEQASFALKRAGFTLVYDRLQNFDPQQRVPLSQYPNMDAQSLAAVMVTTIKFQSSLLCFVVCVLLCRKITAIVHSP